MTIKQTCGLCIACVLRTEDFTRVHNSVNTDTKSLQRAIYKVVV